MPAPQNGITVTSVEFVMERDPSWPTVSHYAAWTVGAVCLLVLLDVAKKRRGRAFRERPADASNER